MSYVINYEGRLTSKVKCGDYVWKLFVDFHAVSFMLLIVFHMVLMLVGFEGAMCVCMCVGLICSASF